MAFQPGNKLGKGRPRGSRNQKIQAFQDALFRWLRSELPQIKDDWIHLPRNQRMKYFSDLLQFAIPKKQSVETEFDKFSDEDLERMVDNLKQKVIDNTNLKAV